MVPNPPVTRWQPGSRILENECEHKIRGYRNLPRKCTYIGTFNINTLPQAGKLHNLTGTTETENQGARTKGNTFYGTGNHELRRLQVFQRRNEEEIVQWSTSTMAFAVQETVTDSNDDLEVISDTHDDAHEMWKQEIHLDKRTFTHKH